MWLIRLFPWWVMLAIGLGMGTFAWQEYDKAQYQYMGPAPEFISIDAQPSGSHFVRDQEVALLGRLTRTVIFETGDKITNRITMLPLTDSEGRVRLILQSPSQSEQAFKTYLKLHTNAEGWVELRGWLREQKEVLGLSELTQKLTEGGFEIGRDVLFVEPFWGDRRSAYQAQTEGYMGNASVAGILSALAIALGLWKFVAWRKRVRRGRNVGSKPAKPARKTANSVAANPDLKPVPKGGAKARAVVAPKPDLKPVQRRPLEKPTLPVSRPISSSAIPEVRREKQVKSVDLAKPKTRKPTPEEVVAKAFGKPVRGKKKTKPKTD